MSQENVEILRAGFDAWNAGDMNSLRERFDPDIIWRPPVGWPEPGPFVGREEVMRWFEQLREAYDSYRTDLIGDLTETGDRVVVSQVWRGAGSGPEADIESTGVFTMHKGRVIGVEQFWERSEALKAAGLQE